MGELKIHMTLDYEVWGNGNGCVIDCMINPTNHLLSIADHFNLKTTLFVDICEYWAFKETEESDLFKDKSYKPASLIEEQLKDVIRRGYDVQLHFHPQWLNYRIIDDYKFELDFNLWRVSSLELGDFDKKNTLKWLFYRGKESLENLLQPVSATYKCTTFRAGAWCIQPEEMVLKAMESVGIFWDSTVAPKMKLSESLTNYNFQKAPSKNEWKFNDKVSKEDKSGMFTEYPIHTLKYSWRSQLYYYFKRISLQKAREKKCIGGGISKSRTFVSRILKKIIQRYHMFDFTTGMSAAELTYQFDQAKRKYKKELENNDIEIIAIAHPKNFSQGVELVSFLNGININGS